MSTEISSPALVPVAPMGHLETADGTLLELREEFLERPSEDPALSIAGLIGCLRIARDGAEKDALMQELLDPASPRVLAFLNQHAVNLAWEQPSLGSDLARADVLLRDGVGVKTALGWMGHEPGFNLNGTDLIPEILEGYRGRRVAIYGTSSPWLETAAAVVAARFGVDVVTTLAGFEDDNVYLEDACATSADLIVLGMGMPKQERIARLLRDELLDPTLIVCGGAILDFLAERVPRAPRWIRRVDLEWAFRLVQEPDRLWGRYGPGGVRFFLRMRRVASITAPAPEERPLGV